MAATATATAATYDIAALKALPVSQPSICIPRVFPNITWHRVKSVFEELGFGSVEKVDMVSKTSPDGKPIKRVFVHFNEWATDNPEVNHARAQLLAGDFVQVTYDQPWFWRCYKSNIPRPDVSKKETKTTQRTTKKATGFKIVTKTTPDGWKTKERVARTKSTKHTGMPTYASIASGGTSTKTEVDAPAPQTEDYQTPPRVHRVATVETRSPPVIERPIAAPTSVYANAEAAEISSLKAELADMKATLRTLLNVMSSQQEAADTATYAPVKKVTTVSRVGKMAPKELTFSDALSAPTEDDTQSNRAITPSSPTLDSLAKKMLVTPFPEMDEDVCWGDLVDSDCE